MRTVRHLGHVLAAVLVLVVPPRAFAQESDPTAQPLVLPTRFCRGYFVAEVQINGAGSFPMIVDSGASVTVVTPETRQAAGIRGRVDELVIGGMTARRVRVIERDLAHLGQALGIDIAGILGHPVFRSLLVTYDYPRRELRIREGSLPPQGEGIVPTGGDDRPFVRARVGDREIRLLVDTGSAGGLTLTDLEDHELTEDPVPIGLRGRIDGFYLKSAARLANDVTVGPLTLPTPMVTNSVSVELLGQDVLEHFAVTFDTDGERMLLERPDAPVETPIVLPAARGLGATLLPRDGYYKVERLFEGSGAGERGLRKDDRIVAIDGERVAELRCHELFAGMEGGRIVSLTVDRGGRAVEIDLPLLEPVR